MYKLGSGSDLYKKNVTVRPYLKLDKTRECTVSSKLEVAAAILLVPEVATRKEQVYLTVELGGNHTRGQVVVGYKSKEDPNTTLVKQIDLELFTKLLLNVHNL